jgi:hypothetical protein
MGGSGRSLWWARIVLHAGVLGASVWFGAVLAGQGRGAHVGFNPEGFVSLLVLIFLLGSWAALVPMFLWMAWEYWGSVRASAVPVRFARCGRCRYPVAGRPSAVCPECGSTELSTEREPDVRGPLMLGLTHVTAVVLTATAIEVRCTIEERRFDRMVAGGFVGWMPRAWPCTDCHLVSDGKRIWAND